MLAIALLGRKAMGRLGFFTRHAEAVRRAFGVLILASVAYIASGFDAQTLFASNSKVAEVPAGHLELVNGLAHPYAAPHFAGISAWLNSKPLTMQQLKGKVVLVDFWTYSCINCVRTLPYITAWDKKYRDQGLVIVGVHAPEFEFEKNVNNVRAAIAKHGIHYPVALDNKLDTWSNFHNRYWPAHYLIDRDGKVVYTHFGEGEYDVTENNIRYLLGLKGKAVPMQERSTYSPGQTPETYLGYYRAESYAGKPSVAHDAMRRYILPKTLPADGWALGGGWKVEGEKIVATGKDASLRLSFKARKVFLVLGTTSGKPLQASITLDGKPVAGNAGKDARAGTVTVARNTLYELIDQHAMKSGLLEIRAQQPGLEAYAFTFGS